MPSDYTVSGSLAVAGVAPGGTVTLEALTAAKAPIEILVAGGHIKPASAEVSGTPATASKPRKGKKETPTGQEVEAS